MSQKDDMIIRFSGLKPGVYNYGFDLADEFFEEYENDEIAGGKVKIDVVMERMEHMLMFTFRLNGEVTTFCDRCLGKMNVPVDGEEHLCVRFSDTETAVEMDLAQWLYEYVAVRIPMQHIHPDGDCDPEVTKFIVDEEQKNEDEIDPRWEALKKLK